MDFYYCPQVKRNIKGKRFADISEVKTKTMELFSNITPDKFKKCFEQCKKRLNNIIILVRLKKVLPKKLKVLKKKKIKTFFFLN